jgi:acyl carrier protein
LNNIESIVFEFIKKKSTDITLKDVNTELSMRDILDSIDMMAFLAYIEEELNIHIGTEEVTQNNFNTLNSVVEFLKQKLASP